MKRLSLRAVSLAFAILPALWAQFKPANPAAQQGPESPNTFSVKVSLVRLLVSVKNQTGAPVTNLSKDDFEVLDSGAPQNIAVFERNTSLPLSVAILIDTSGSTQIDLHYEEDSVLKFVPTLLGAGNPQDTFALFSFNWR